MRLDTGRDGICCCGLGWAGAEVKAGGILGTKERRGEERKKREEDE